MPKKYEFSSEDFGARKTIIVLCIDTSNSLYTWQKEINVAIRAFMDELDNEPKSRYGTEIAVVTYDTTPRLHSDFSTNKSSIKPISIPHHNPSGGWTDMGEALSYSIDLAINQWKLRKSQGVQVYLPWVILFTDGKSENKERNALKKMETAISKLQEFESPRKERDKIHFIGIGVGENVDASLMRRISAHGDLRYLHSNNFSSLSKLFKFVGATTVKATDVRIEYDDVASSFPHQKAKDDKPEVSFGGSGYTIESPIFTEPTVQSNYVQGGFFTQTESHDIFSFNNSSNDPITSHSPTVDVPPVESPLEEVDAYFLEIRKRGNQNAGWFS